MLKEIKKGIVIALSFAITLGLIGISYATWIDLTNVGVGNPLTADMFNKVLENQRDLKSSVDGLTVSNINMPIGSIVAWHKDLTGVSALPTGWIECDGSVINDVHSPLNGQNTPNLNNQVYSGGKGYYLRGGVVSGVFNASTAWDDNGTAYSTSYGSRYGSATAGFRNLENSDYRNSYSTSKLDPDNYRFQVAAMTVVYIMKIK